MTKHSTLIGGSSADRIINCPGSWKAIGALPELPEGSNPAADHGSFCHAVVERILKDHKGRPLPETKATRMMLDLMLINMIGEHFYDRVLTEEHCTESILPALAQLHDIMSSYNEQFTVTAVEMSVTFPRINGGFGTLDLLMTSPSYVLLVDFKFGNVPIPVVFHEPAGDRINPQPLFYLAAAMATKPALFRNKQLIVAIVQPAGEASHTVVDRDEVTAFIEDVEKAITAAMSRKPKLRRGSWCKYCEAKPTCPEWMGKVEALAQVAGVIVPKAVPASVKHVQAYVATLVAAKDLVETLIPYKDEIDAQIYAFLASGVDVPGWKLIQKEKMRKWIEPAKVEAALVKLGFTHPDIWREQLVTFASADATAKKLNVTIPAALRVAPPSTELTIAPVTDPAPRIEIETAAKQFAASVAALKSRKG